MLTGRFEPTTGRPYIDAYLTLPRIGIQGHLSFLIDTGADGSALMPADALRLGVDFGKLRPQGSVGGIGGSVKASTEDALLMFTKPNVSAYVYKLQLCIVEPRNDTMDLPSLLGRDVIDQWNITYAPGKSVLTARLLSYDERINLKPEIR